MPTFFLFILLAFSIVGQALQYGAADNDTLALTKRILEDMFGTGNLDKRMMEKTAQPPPPPPSPPPPYLYKRISLPLKYSVIYRYWYFEVPVATRWGKFRFVINTFEICSTAPADRLEFDWVGEPGKRFECPSLPFLPGTGSSGRERQGKIVFHETLTLEGLFVSIDGIRDCGTLGWVLDDKRVPERLHTLPSLLAKFESHIFAMYLTHRPGKAKIDIGGVDDHVGHIEYHKVVKTGKDFQPWLIESLRVYVGNERIELGIKPDTDIKKEPNIKARTNTEAEPNPKAEPNIETAFNSIAQYLIGPPSQVAQIQAKIFASRSLVYFQWGDGGKKWPLQPVDPEYDPKSPVFWESYTKLLRAGHPEMESWYLGVPFWIDKYMVFDKNSLEPQVGIGEMLPVDHPGENVAEKLEQPQKHPSSFGSTV